MKNKILVSILFFYSIFAFGQVKDSLAIFKNSKKWGKEIIKFPIDWAPDLKITGFEELLFAPNWSDKKDDNFWSLVIGWNIETKKPLPLKKIENNFKGYFDGLMKPNHWAKEFPNPEVNFIKNSDTNFSGKMKLFDGFHTGKVIDINIEGEQIFCKKHDKTIIIFRLSYKTTEHKIWKTLKEIELKEKFCN